MFTHRYRHVFALALAAYSYLNTLFLETMPRYSIQPPEWLVLLVIMLIVGGIWEGNRLLIRPAQRVQERYLPTIHPILVHFMGSIGLVLLLIIPLVSLAGKGLLGYSDRDLLMPMKLCIVFGFRVNLFLHIINAVNFLLRQYRESQLEAEQLKKATAQAQLQHLKSQINPHFLFNNFNVLSRLVDKDPASAKEFIQQLSLVYRHVLEQSDRELVPLHDEMKFLQSYCYLLGKRFNGSLRIRLNVPETYYQYYIVPVSLQMVFENAIKHNISSHSRPLSILVSVSDDTPAAEPPFAPAPSLVVTNNVQPRTDVAESTQVGLKNISQRYQVITQRTINVQHTGDTFRVILPLIRLADEHPDNRR